ncbi:hypothetical protein [Acetobacter syzygii]|uniref:hypothetical protein n=1 Tax=Acetobacter syzygii TaxID=146476 RepID=UPI000AF52867|nr:hypothetical protein [Acetobacter syzygii]NSL91456.1 hypothetical protein [Acetobacter syzygii]
MQENLAFHALHATQLGMSGNSVVVGRGAPPKAGAINPVADARAQPAQTASVI